MLVDVLDLIEGSDINNLVVDSGAAFPSTPNAGELFYKTTTTAGLYVYDGSNWNQAGAGGGLFGVGASGARGQTGVGGASGFTYGGGGAGSGGQAGFNGNTATPNLPNPGTVPAANVEVSRGGGYGGGGTATSDPAGGRARVAVVARFVSSGEMAAHSLTTRPKQRGWWLKGHHYLNSP